MVEFLRLKCHSFTSFPVARLYQLVSAAKRCEEFGATLAVNCCLTMILFEGHFCLCVSVHLCVRACVRLCGCDCLCQCVNVSLHLILCFKILTIIPLLVLLCGWEYAHYMLVYLLFVGAYGDDAGVHGRRKDSPTGRCWGLSLHYHVGTGAVYYMTVNKQCGGEILILWDAEF